jgi:hypothetical protein
MAPCVSVIIATYQWSRALRCALRSVLLQTLQDFEVLVIGDGCTDDSEAVVRSFGDARLSWHNLPENSGSQSAPNNRGFVLSTGRTIAYLGHDDIWYPTHLQSLVETIGRRRADLAYAVSIIYGSAESGMRFVMGLLGEDGYTEHDFLPPSSILLTRELLERLGPWRAPSELSVPIDYDVLRRALRAGAVFAGTGQLTVFKFNAAFRRDVYLTKDTGDQEATLARIEAGADFRQEEWAALVRCFLTGRSWATTVPEALDQMAPGAIHARNLQFKGIAPAQVYPRLDRTLHVDLREDTPGFEWHLLESLEPFGSFRWSGPSRKSSILLPVPADQAVAITVKILFAVTPATLAGLRVFLNGAATTATLDRQPDGSFLLRTRHAGHTVPEGRPGGLLLTLEVPRTVSFSQLGQSSDTRPVGIAVNWVEAKPIAPG